MLHKGDYVLFPNRAKPICATLFRENNGTEIFRPVELLCCGAPPWLGFVAQAAKINRAPVAIRKSGNLPIAPGNQNVKPREESTMTTWYLDMQALSSPTVNCNSLPSPLPGFVF
jgi:hypothetical protein